jgi:hypothetical protein
VEPAEAWRNLFENWPAALPQEGIVVTIFNEQIPFTAFMVSGGILLLERDKPDQFNARKVMVAYSAIAAVKSTSPMELARFQVMGFQPPM